MFEKLRYGTAVSAAIALPIGASGTMLYEAEKRQTPTDEECVANANNMERRVLRGGYNTNNRCADLSDENAKTHCQELIEEARTKAMAACTTLQKGQVVNCSKEGSEIKCK